MALSTTVRWAAAAVHAVRACVELDKPASIRVLEKSGFEIAAHDTEQATYDAER